MTATFVKLKTGSWGVRSSENYTSGSEVVVSRKSGEGSRVRIHAKVWSGDGGTLYSIQAKASGGPKSRLRSRGDCEECGEKILTDNQRCWETGGICGR